MRRLALLTTAILMAGFWIAIPRASAAIVCTGDMTGTITGAVTVPTDSGNDPCRINNADVQGAITVKPGGDLRVTNSNVQGGITANGAENIDIAGATIGGAYTVVGSTDDYFDFEVCNSTVGGGVTVRQLAGSDRLVMDGATDETNCDFYHGSAGKDFVNGPVLLKDNSGDIEVSVTKVQGDLTATGNGNVELEANKVGGYLACSTNSSIDNGGGDTNTAAVKTGQCKTL